MRLSDKHRDIIREMRHSGYVWLSDLSKNAVMRFRNRTRAGFSSYFKLEGLTFMTRRLAAALERGVKRPGARRLTLKEQLQLLEKELFDAEKELYGLKGEGISVLNSRLRNKSV